MAAAMLAAGAVSGGSNMISSMGSAGIQQGASEKLQENDQNFSREMAGRAESSFTSVGLPKYMAYSGGAQTNTSLPGSQFHLHGSNYFNAGLVGQSVPFISTDYQTLTHTGKPENPNSPNSRPIRAPQQSGMNYMGQFDRVGLGSGRYSSVPPPSTNNQGTNTNLNMRSPNMRMYSSINSSLVRDGYGSNAASQRNGFSTHF